MSITTRTPRPALRRHLPAVAALGLALAVTTACGGSTAGSGGAGTTVTVTMTEFSFTLDRPSLAPGDYIFHAVNAGKAPHAIELGGAGLDEKKSAVVPPGQSTDLAVTLQAGDLDMYCPVDGHRGKGMETHIAVGSAGAPAPSGGSDGY